MSMETVVTLVLGAILSLATSLLLIKVNRIDKKADKRYNDSVDREVLLCTHRTDESVLLLEVVEAVQRGKCNGELGEAKKQFVETNRKYNLFVQTQAGTRFAENK